MSEILKFVKLDFVTFKNTMGSFKALILLIAVVMYFFFGIFSLAGLLPMVLPMLTIQNFAAGNDGLDLFYTSLHLKRKSVVFGRYAFIISVNTVVLMLFFGLSFLRSENLLSQVVLVQILSILSVSMIMDFFNTTLLFRLGFKKGKIIAQSLPLFLMLGVFGYLYFGGILSDIPVDTNPADLMNYVQLPELNPLTMLGVWLMLSIISIFLSLKFYTKRELG